MQEIVTDAIVLTSRSYSNRDRLVSLLTKELGRVEAKVISGSKTTSKLSPHLDPLNTSRVRLINKNRFIVVDALTRHRNNRARGNPEGLKNAIDALFMTHYLMPEHLPDTKLWYMIENGLNKSKFNYKILLKTLGYDPLLAECFGCKSKKPNFFFAKDQIFLCQSCASRFSGKEQLIKID